MKNISETGTTNSDNLSEVEFIVPASEEWAGETIIKWRFELVFVA